MNMLKEFVIENAEIIDNLEWRKLADKIQDSGLDIPQIARLTDTLKETTNLEGLSILWCHFCNNKTIESFIVPDTVTEMSFNVFYDSEIGYLKLSPNTVKIDTEAFYNSEIKREERNGEQIFSIMEKTILSASCWWHPSYGAKNGRQIP